jgi:chemotaxis protein methyltransferase CheR
MNAWAVAELSPGDFRRARAMLHAAAGIHLNDSKRTMVASRLAKRLRATGHSSYPRYLDHVEAPGSVEWTHFVNALTTNLTSFFREPYHFPVLVEHVRRVAARAPGRTVHLWSAGCSTGQEPYSMAIALAEAFDGRPPVRIVASDIDTDTLEFAARGTYPMAKLQGLTPAQIKRHFLCGVGANDGLARVRPAIRDLVDFKAVNLRDAEWDVPESLAAIFCRNVMIYFARDTQSRLVRRFAQRLAPDGLLFAGHSENLHYIAGDLYRTRGHTVYEVAGEAAR